MSKTKFGNLKVLPLLKRRPKKDQVTIRTQFIDEFAENRNNIKLNERKAYVEFRKNRANRSFVRLTTAYMKRGKIYTFLYNEPLNKKTLKYYDKKPTVLSLGVFKSKHGKVVEVGINLNYLSYRHKLNLAEAVYNLDPFLSKEFEERKSIEEITKQKPLTIKFNYQWCVRYLTNIGFKFALRSYKKELRKRTYEFNYNQYLNALSLKTADFEKKNEKEIADEFREYYKESVLLGGIKKKDILKEEQPMSRTDKVKKRLTDIKLKKML